MTHAGGRGKEGLLRGWDEGVRILDMANIMASKRCSRANDVIGVLVLVTTTFVGSTIFATLGTSAKTTVQVVAGVVSFVAVALAGIQKFFGFETRAIKHKEAAQIYGSIRMDIQILLAELADGTSANLDKRITDIKTRWDELEKTAPTVPEGIYQKCRKICHAPEAKDEEEKARGAMAGA